jgi:hypothetical protein
MTRQNKSDNCCCSCHESKYKTGDIILVKNMFHRLQDVGVCPDQLEQFDETLECETCDMVGSFFLIDEKYEIGLCYKCMLKNYKETGREVFENMNDEKIAIYYNKRETQCYDLWCHKGHLRNMDKNSHYQDRNGEVCNYTHPYQNAYDEMVGYYKIVDGVRYDYVMDKDEDLVPFYRQVTSYNSDDPDFEHEIGFEEFENMIESGEIHHPSYKYPGKYKFTFTVNDMNSEQEAWDFLHRTLDECKVKDVFNCEKVEVESE